MTEHTRQAGDSDAVTIAPDPLSDLARELWWQMDRLIPGEFEGWEDVPSRDREFYRLVVEGFLENVDMINFALQFTKDGVVNGRSPMGK